MSILDYWCLMGVFMLLMLMIIVIGAKDEAKKNH